MVAPKIATNPNAQEEADCLNMFHLAVLGAKEGDTEGIIAIIGSNITDAILHIVDDGNMRNISKYSLHKLMEVVIGRAD